MSINSTQGTTDVQDDKLTASIEVTNADGERDEVIERLLKHYYETGSYNYMAECPECGSFSTWQRESEYVRRGRQGNLRCGNCRERMEIVKDLKKNGLTHLSYQTMKTAEDMIEEAREFSDERLTEVKEMHSGFLVKLYNEEDHFVSREQLQAIESTTSNKDVAELFSIVVDNTE